MVRFKNKEIKNYGEPYIIAELGSNHNGDMELAKQLIIAAKKAGADCVKFQSWSKETVFSRQVYKENVFLKDDYRNRTDYTLEQIVEKFSVSEKEILILKIFCDQIGIDCSSTPFAKREVDFLAKELDAPFMKIASMDLNNYHFLDYIARKGLPMVLSTGLSELSEIDMAIRTIEKAGNCEIVILHCISLYPPKDEEVNLNNIETLQKLYPYPVGFSDHTIGTAIPLAAVAKGACIIEKHFTLDKNMFGWDHKISSTPDELMSICQEAKRINHALGSHRIICVEDEGRKNAFRRSGVAVRNMKLGEIVNIDDIDFKRPGTGIPPVELSHIVGRKLKKAKQYDELFAWEDFE